MTLITILWLALTVIFFIIEAISVGLISIWFAIGSLLAFIVSIFTDNIIIVFIAFAIGTIVTCIFMKYIKDIIPKTITNNTNRLVGMTAIVVEEITALKGRVKVGDVTWSAMSTDENIEEGVAVKIIETNGNTLTVERI